MLAIIPHQISCGVYIKVVLMAFKDSDGVIPAEKRHNRFITLLKLIKNTTLSWLEFQEVCKEDHKIASTCLKEIYEIETLEHLSETFKSFEDLFSHRHAIKILTKSSIFGLFLRRIVLEYKKMTYQNVNELLKHFHQYLNLSSQAEQSNSKIFNYSVGSSMMEISCMDESFIEEKENIPVTPSSAGLNNSLKKTEDTDEDIFKSENKVERFISEQIYLLSSNDKRALNPSEMKTSIENIKKHYPHVNDIHYLEFLNYLRVSEIHNAMSSLRIYFDYKSFKDKNDENELTDLEKHQLKFKQFRYCALNLGMMHCYYHNYLEAHKSLEEAISVAQETNDQDCLNHAAFWLGYAKEKSKGNNNTNKVSLIELFETDDMGNVKRFLDIEYLSQLMHVKTESLQGRENPSRLLSLLSKISNMGPGITAHTSDLTKSAMLYLYGLSNMAIIYPQIVLSKRKSGLQALNEMINEESLILSLLQLAVHHGIFCLSNESSVIIDFAKANIPLYSSLTKKVQFFKLHIEFDVLVNERKISEIVTNKNAISLLDRRQGEYLATVTDLICGNFKKANKKIQNILSQQILDTPELKAKFMCLRIEILLVSSQPSFVMNEIINVLKYTEEHYMLGIKLVAKLYLVHCFNLLGLYVKAEACIDDIIVGILSHGSYLQQGVMFLSKGRSLRLKLQNVATDNDKIEKLLTGLNYVKKALTLFQKGNMLSKLLDVYAEFAFYYNELGYLKERNESSTQFRTLSQTLKGIPRFLLL